MLNFGNPGLPFRVALVFCQQFLQAEIISSAKSGIDLVCLLQIFWSVDREAQMPQAGLHIHHLHLEPARRVIQIGHHVFTLVGPFSLLPGLLQCFKRAHFCVHPDWGSTLKRRRQSVGSKIDTAFQEGLDHAFNLFRRDHRAIGSNTHNHVCFVFKRSLVKAVQHIVRVSAEASDPVLVAIVQNWFICRIAGRSDNNIVNEPSLAHTRDHPRQHWLTVHLQ